jgi:glycerophosphoryl diester phosphodiesterase
MSMETRPLLLGHRGARAVKSIPENTQASFDLSLAEGADGFEFDVRLTADGQAVLCHDARIRGMEIAKCSAGKLRLPSLREVLARYRHTAFLDIELKVAGLEQQTADLLRSLPPKRDFVVSSFLPQVLENLHAIDPKIPLGLICETQSQVSLWTELPIQYAILQQKLLREKLIADIKSAGKKIFVWTVNLGTDMKRFAAMKVDGIISDNPKLLVRILGRNVPQSKED